MRARRPCAPGGSRLHARRAHTLDQAHPVPGRHGRRLFGRGGLLAGADAPVETAPAARSPTGIGASIGGMKKADAFFMLVLFIGLNVGCSRAAKKKLPETREVGRTPSSRMNNRSQMLENVIHSGFFISKRRVRHFANPDFIDSG